MASFFILKSHSLSELFVKETKKIIFQIVEEEVERFEDNDLEKRSTQVNLSNEVKRRIDNIQEEQDKEDKKNKRA